MPLSYKKKRLVFTKLAASGSQVPASLWWVTDMFAVRGHWSQATEANTHSGTAIPSVTSLHAGLSATTTIQAPICTFRLRESTWLQCGNASFVQILILSVGLASVKRWLASIERRFRFSVWLGGWDTLVHLVFSAEYLAKKAQGLERQIYRCLNYSKSEACNCNCEHLRHSLRRQTLHVWGYARMERPPITLRESSCMNKSETMVNSFT